MKPCLFHSRMDCDCPTEISQLDEARTERFVRELPPIAVLAGFPHKLENITLVENYKRTGRSVTIEPVALKTVVDGDIVRKTYPKVEGKRIEVHFDPEGKILLMVEVF